MPRPFSPRMRALSTLRSHGSQPIASGATPAPTRAAPSPGFLRAGLCLRFRRNTQSVLRLVLPTSGAGPLVQDGYTVEPLPKLAFFPLWDGPPLEDLPGNCQRDGSEARLPISSPPPADPVSPADPIGGGAGCAEIPQIRMMKTIATLTTPVLSWPWNRSIKPLLTSRHCG